LATSVEPVPSPASEPMKAAGNAPLGPMVVQDSQNRPGEVPRPGQDPAKTPTNLPARNRRFELLTYGSGGQENTPRTSRKRRKSLGGVTQVCKFPLIPTLGRRGRADERPTPRVSSRRDR
jgi:hypothetical protein